MEIATVRATSWIHLLDELYRDSWDRDIERFRSPFVFRGLCDAGCGLSTTLARLATGHKDIAKLEGHLLRNFRKYAHESGDSGLSIWHWMTLAAHHGLQTRMLDWTYSPFVALHFATDNPAWHERDAIVWCVNHAETNKVLPEVLRRVCDEEGSNAFTVEMLSSVAAGLDELGELAAEPFVLFLEPPSLDARIVNQFALFSLMSSPEARLDHWLAAHPGLCRRIVIPASLKWEVRDKLDQANITERLLFPGLDGLARWLSRYYRQARPR